ncbi:hypothetical protein [Adhaeribacter aquaticus]|uniref:hypothetical protein n=1 Tax=Adhaeribacter aquaticus TaxID=299567 RepID=UPI000424D9D7|nr:hypothetical protein [Adhaeribacter aquaticus]
MKYYILFLFGFLTLTGTTCSQNEELPPFLFGKIWIHAAEEDNLEIKVYRPNTYPFPPARGRTGFALEKEGVFKLYTIAPTDGLEEHEGNWKLIKPNQLQVTFKDATYNLNLEFVSISENLLSLRFHSNSKK